MRHIQSTYICIYIYTLYLGGGFKHVCLLKDVDPLLTSSFSQMGGATTTGRLLNSGAL